MKVLVSVSVDAEKNRPKYVKFKVISDLSGPTLEAALTQHVQLGATVKTDGYRGHSRFSKAGYDHAPRMMTNPEDNKAHLPWVHILISNAKRFILGTHHSVEYLQSYLDEFAWRFNRRFTNLFDRLLFTTLQITCNG